MDWRRISEHPIPSGLVVVFIAWLASVVVPTSRRWWLAGIDDTARWFARNVLLPRWQFVAWIALAIFLSGAVGFLLAKKLWSKRRERADDSLSGAVPSIEPSKQVVPELRKTDLSVLRVVASNGKDAPVPLSRICAELKITEQRALLACERLHERVFVIAAGRDGDDVRLFQLTSAGRAECHRHGWI
jgi:hypothetical protein